MNNKKFTLIELIVVIAILGILASLIVPNISSFKGDATVTAITANVRNFQTSVDMYSLKNNGQYPTTTQPTEFIPQPIDFTKLDRTYMKTLPKTNGVKYWVDFQGRVWASTIDAPINVVNNNGNVTWTPVIGAVKYQVFEVQGYGGVIGTLSRSKANLTLKGETTNTSYVGEINKNYVINAIDEQNLQTAPAGSNYRGYVLPNKQQPTEGSGNQNPTPVNHKPVATITMNQEQELLPTTNINFNYTFTDEDGDTISQTEWQIDTNPVQTTTPNGTFTQGNHVVKLRIQDNRGLWSDWYEKQFTINIIDTVKLGQTLTSPDQGWRRYEETDVVFSYLGNNWLGYSSSVFSGGSMKYSNALNSKVEFSFKGTKLRIIGQNYSDGSQNIEIYIDGVKENFSQNVTDVSNTTQRVNFEKFNLSNTIHTISIVNKATNSFVFRLDAVDIDNTGYIYQQQTTSETGWRRYDETDAGFTYSGSNWSVYNSSAFLGGTIKYTNMYDSKVEFSFKGTKLRVIGQNYNDGSPNIEIYIDGVKESFSQYLATVVDPTTTTKKLNYEKVGLSDTIHTVSIVNKTTNSTLFRFDAIDIDYNGTLLTQ